MRIGTRGSALALAQAGLVAAVVGEAAEVVTITTTGDRDRAAPDKEKWVKELERALVDGEVDVAVHSAKDVPAVLPDGLALVGCLPREDPRDVVVGALRGRVGTSSLRRRAQLLAADPELDVVEVRGNVDTRLRKLAAGEVDGLVLAAAGLRRLGRPEAALPLDGVPAVGQGVVVLEARAGATLDVPRDAATWAALGAERACVRVLGADCRSALGVHHDGRTLRAWVGAPDGARWVADALDGAPTPDQGEAIARRLLGAGAGALL